MVRIVIAGSRFFNDYKTLEEIVIRKLFELNKTYPEYNILTVRRSEKSYKINPENIEIISGMASGADSLAVKFANNYGLKLIEFPAEWKNLNAVPCKIMENSHGRYNALGGIIGIGKWRNMLHLMMLSEFSFYFGMGKAKEVRI